MLTTSFSELYGDYSGTRVLHANGIIADVIAFFERSQYGPMSATIVAQSTLVPEEAVWFRQGAGALYWKDFDTVRRVKNDERINDCFHLITCVEGSIDSKSISKEIRILEQSGWRAEEVFFGNHASCSIVVCGSGRSNPSRIKGLTTVLRNGYSTRKCVVAFLTMARVPEASGTSLDRNFYSPSSCVLIRHFQDAEAEDMSAPAREQGRLLSFERGQCGLLF